MQKLSMRLQALADFVTKGNRLADIGTDHGYLPIYLIQQGLVPSALAMDLRVGPLQRAKDHIEEAGLSGQIQTRLSDGLDQLGEGEADTIILAGMGGLLTIRILQEAGTKLTSFKELVLGPQSEMTKVRRFLREKNMKLDKERLVLEDGKYYPILHVLPVSKTDYRKWEQEDAACLEELKRGLSKPQYARALADQYGLFLIVAKDPVLQELLERDRRQQELILQSLEASGKQRDRKDQVREKMEAVKSLQEYVS